MFYWYVELRRSRLFTGFVFPLNKTAKTYKTGYAYPIGM